MTERLRASSAGWPVSNKSAEMTKSKLVSLTGIKLVEIKTLLLNITSPISSGDGTKSRKRGA